MTLDADDTADLWGDPDLWLTTADPDDDADLWQDDGDPVAAMEG